jgi:hypothetical protein
MKRMQAKDIPAADVLDSIRRHGERAGIYTLWADDFEPKGVPFKVLRAKMDKLGRQGIVDCCCNLCNGWISMAGGQE